MTQGITTYQMAWVIRGGADDAKAKLLKARALLLGWVRRQEAARLAANLGESLALPESGFFTRLHAVAKGASCTTDCCLSPEGDAWSVLYTRYAAQDRRLTEEAEVSLRSVVADSSLIVTVRRALSMQTEYCFLHPEPPAIDPASFDSLGPAFFAPAFPDSRILSGGVDVTNALFAPTKVTTSRTAENLRGYLALPGRKLAVALFAGTDERTEAEAARLCRDLHAKAIVCLVSPDLVESFADSLPSNCTFAFVPPFTVDDEVRRELVAKVADADWEARRLRIVRPYLGYTVLESEAAGSLENVRFRRRRIECARFERTIDRLVPEQFGAKLIGELRVVLGMHGDARKRPSTLSDGKNISKYPLTGGGC